MVEPSARRAIQPTEIAALSLGLATIAGCGFVILTSSATLAWWSYVLWIAALTAAINLGISFESGEANFSSIVIIASFLALGLGPSAFITLAGVLLGEGVRHLIPGPLGFTPRGWRYALVTASSNLSLHGLSLLIGGTLYTLSGGFIPIVNAGQTQWTLVDFPHDLAPLLALFGGYLFTNYTLFGLYLRLEGEHVRDYIHRHWRTLTLLEVLPTFFAILMAFAYLNTPPLVFTSVTAFMIVVMALIHTLSRARARLEQRVRELNSLSVLSQAVANSLELPEVLEAVYQQTRQLMDAPCFYVALHTGEDDQLVFPLAYENNVRVRYDSHAFGSGLTEHVIATRRPLLIPHNVRSVLDELGIVPNGPLAQSWLGVPIVFGDEILGAIGVQNLEQPDRYTAAHRDILITIAAQAAAAIHNAQTYITARHHTTNLAILNSVSMVINSTLDLSRVLDVIVTSVGRVMGNQKAAIFLADEAGQSVSLAASHNLSPHYVAQSRALPIEPDSRAVVVLTRQPLIVDDVQTDPRLSGFRAAAEAEGYRAFADVPLQTHAQAIGGLTVYYAEAHHFTLAETDLLNTFANQAAVAVVNAKRYGRADQALTRRIDQLAALEQLGRDLSASLDFDQVIRRVLDRAMAATGANYGLIGLWHPDWQVIRVTVGQGYSREYSQAVVGTDWPVTRGLVGRAVRSGQLQRVSDVRQDPDYVAVDDTVRSELVVLIRQDDRILGVINLESGEINRFDQAAADFVSQLATQAAIALHNAQLYREAQTRLREMESLYAIGQQLTSILDLQQLGRELTRQMAHALNSTYCALTLLRKPTGLMEVIGQYYDLNYSRLTSTPDLPAAYPLADFPARQLMFEYREPLIVYRTDPHADPAELARLQMYNIQALLDIPLVALNEVYGAVEWADSHADRTFSPGEIRLASTLANQAAIAVQNARLFDAIAAGRDQVQAVLNSTHDGILMFDRTSRILLVNPELEKMWGLARADLEGRTLLDLLDQPETQLAARLGLSPSTAMATLQHLPDDQPLDWPKEVFALSRQTSDDHGHAERYVERTCLPVRDAQRHIIGWMLVLRDVTEERELQRLRDELTNTIVHDLRSPLTSILGGLHMLKDMVTPGQPESLESQALTISIRSTNKLLNLINSLLDISRLESGQALANLQAASLIALIDMAIIPLAPLAQEVAITIRQQTPADLPLVLVDEDKICRVLTNLLDNALKFTPAGGQITVLAERWPANPAYVRCAVRDTGPGIPVEFRTRIFERFVQLSDQAGRRRGNGLGLSFCHLAVEAHGGQIWIDDAPGGGSEFSFTVKAIGE